MIDDKAFNFYSSTESGHRVDYIGYSSAELGGTRKKKILPILFSSKPLLFLMADDAFGLYLCVALCRGFVGRRTVGLIFRAKSCLKRDNYRVKLKYLALKFLRKIKSVSSISIVPFYIEERIEEICDDWIYDFQFCDKSYLLSQIDMKEANRFVESIAAEAKGRKVVCAIGQQNKLKGFDEFAKLYIESIELQQAYLFVSGGEIKEIPEDLLSRFKLAGGLMFNQRITNAELVGLYTVADLIWACYSSIYDQSSGVLGRAFQYDKTIIARQGSVIHTLSVNLGMNHLVHDSLTVNSLIEFPDNMVAHAPKVNIKENRLKLMEALFGSEPILD